MDIKPCKVTGMMLWKSLNHTEIIILSIQQIFLLLYCDTLFNHLLHITVTHKIHSCTHLDLLVPKKLCLPKKNAGYTRRWNRDTSDSSTGISGTNPNAIIYGIVSIIINVEATGQTTTQRKFLSWKFLAPFFELWFFGLPLRKNLYVNIKTFLIINVFKSISQPPIWTEQSKCDGNFYMYSSKCPINQNIR